MSRPSFPVSRSVGCGVTRCAARTRPCGYAQSAAGRRLDEVERRVAPADLDATVGIADDTGAAVVDVVHVELVEEARLRAFERLAGVVVVAEIAAAALHPLGERRDVRRRGTRVPHERFLGGGTRLL